MNSNNLMLDFYKNISVCNVTVNPWCGSFGLQQYVEIIFLSFLMVSGVFGNLLVIFSILIERKTFRHGNIFIINLAVADILATGFYTPSVIVNVLAQGPGFDGWLCHIFGFLIIVACSSSMWNLAFIALSRYWAVVRGVSYKTAFSKKKIFQMVEFTWIWASLLALPTVVGWSQLTYDYKAMTCSWDDQHSSGYNIFLMTCAVLIPLVTTIFCYSRILLYVIIKRHKLEKSKRRPSTNYELETMKRRIRKEMCLLKTLAAAVAVFIFCWTPYATVVIFSVERINPLLKKISTWLGLCNSSVNFIIYGILNQGFRDGYRKLLKYVFCFHNCGNTEEFRARNNSTDVAGAA